MSKNPFINALGALSYILIVSLFFCFASQTQRNKLDTFFAPVAMLSLLTLSAAVMAFIFFYQPVLYILDGKKKEAVDLFFKTVAIFGGFTVLIWVLITLGLL